MVELGYALSSEEHPPDDLVDDALRAEDVGFEHALVSDHYHPWVSEQGHSPFVWSVLGAIARETDSIRVGTGVTCPIKRIHPAVVAQAAATTADLFDGRFFFGVGTGENLNEHVVGGRWPPFDVRLSMLAEAVDVIRELWRGDEVTHRGEHYTVENARLYTLPEERPPICVSAYGERAARAAAEIGDGFWSVGPQDVVETWEIHGGEGPRICQLQACVAETDADAASTVHEQWPISGLPGELGSVLPTPAYFEQAAEMVTEEDVAEGSVLLGPDVDQHVEAIQEAVDAGYDHVYVHQIGNDQAALVERYREAVLPSFS